MRAEMRNRPVDHPHDPGERPQGSGGGSGVSRRISAGFRTGAAEMRDRDIRDGR